ncbi:MAG TPA: class I SAM-dependent methyltransferase [Steroidobacteraceae bacterium]|jgi:SAM-dependent methyltransferase|nr:class I SAM-dependent methyltransferase [Steroidobacteraceae bacterium]
MAQNYDRERDADPVYRACVRQAVADLHPAGTVLDCGCGTGLATPYLLCAEAVYAVDYSERMLEKVRRKFAHQVHTARADVRDLPYPDNTFDCVLVANVLQHLAPGDQPRAAAEIMRTLKPGGRYAVSVHHFSERKRRAGWRKEGKPGGRGDCDYIFRYTRAELAALFPRARIRAIGFPGLPGQVTLARLAGRVLARLGHGHMICAYGVAN